METASDRLVCVCSIPWAPVERTCLICHALYWTSSGVMQLEGTVVITVGVGWPLGVGPPSFKPFLNLAAAKETKNVFVNSCSVFIRSA